MHPDLSLLIDLQRIDSAIAAARKVLNDLPAREAAAEAKIAAATAAREATAQRVADNKAGRAALEKDLAVVQGRLSRFKDQTMAVKTNKEFHALQHEIATAQEEIRKFEDQMLELMMESDDLAAALKAADAALKEAERATEATRRDLSAERQRVDADLDARKAERDALAATVPRQALALFTSVSAKASGVAVAPVHDGHCSVCHVRLRPHVAQAVHANESIIQCENCSRILYFAPRAVESE